MGLFRRNNVITTGGCSNGHDQRLRDNPDGSRTVYCTNCDWTQQVPKQ